MKTTDRRFKRKVDLYKQQKGRCYWCKHPVVLIKTSDSKVHSKIKMYATIDHLRMKGDPTRSEPNQGEQRWVLACRPCNNHRHNPFKKL